MLEKWALRWTHSIDDIHTEFETEMIDHYEYSPEVKAMPGAEDVMIQLKERGIKVALNTGFSKQ
jgi:phosphoserine phosphatase